MTFANTVSLKNFEKETKLDPQVDEFFKTESYSKISKQFNISKQNFDLKNIEIFKITDKSNMIRIKVQNENRVDFITLMPNNTVVLYEKTLLNEEGNGVIQQFDENGILIANFDVRKQLETFTVKLTYVNNTNAFDSQVECINKTYDVIKSTCDKDATCTMSCNIAPNCAVVMYGVAVAHCAATGNTPPKKALSTLSASVN